MNSPSLATYWEHCIPILLHWLNENVVRLHCLCSSHLGSEMSPTALSQPKKLPRWPAVPLWDPEVTPPDHPATQWTCRLVKWPTALILHIKVTVKKKKKKEKKEKSSWPLFLSVIGHTMLWRNSRRNGLVKREGRGVNIMTFTYPFFSVSIHRRMEDGWRGVGSGEWSEGGRKSLHWPHYWYKKSTATFPISPPIKLSGEIRCEVCKWWLMP